MKSESNESKKKTPAGAWSGMGIALGAGVGVALGLCLGIAFGASVGHKEKKSK